jgi:hypothetical protein
MAGMTWNEVVALHNSQSGISTKGGIVRSVLCNQAKESYADEIRSDAVFYRVTAKTNPVGVHALRGMIGLKKAIRVFEKLRVNHWLDHGEWFVHAHAEEDDGWVFFFRRSPP